MKSNLTTYTVEVKGRVQGVGYRAWVEKKVRDFDLQGWVMNSEDKSVKMELSGKKKNIKIFLSECYKGPLLSKVLEVTENGARVYQNILPNDMKYCKIDYLL